MSAECLRADQRRKEMLELYGPLVSAGALVRRLASRPILLSIGLVAKERCLCWCSISLAAEAHSRRPWTSSAGWTPSNSHPINLKA